MCQFYVMDMTEVQENVLVVYKGMSYKMDNVSIQLFMMKIVSITKMDIALNAEMDMIQEIITVYLVEEWEDMEIIEIFDFQLVCIYLYIYYILIFYYLSYM